MKVRVVPCGSYVLVAERGLCAIVVHLGYLIDELPLSARRALIKDIEHLLDERMAALAEENAVSEAA
jgi:hypothetical protein